MFSVDRALISCCARGLWRCIYRSVSTLTTGFHVSWLSDAEGYALEQAESAAGPWIRREGTPIFVEGQNIVVMDLQSRSKFYRLTKAN